MTFHHKLQTPQWSERWAVLSLNQSAVLKQRDSNPLYKKGLNNKPGFFHMDL